MHREHRVDLRIGVGVHGFEGGAHVERVVLTDGSVLPADVVIVGIGLIPNTDLAEEARIEVADGIVVDRFSVTSDPDIVAAGDCTQHENIFFGYRMRLESVPNALEQAPVAAASIVGKQRAYDAVPWFWSDQYDLKLQMVGLSHGYDKLVVRGSLDANSFVAFYLKDGVVIAADSVNRAAGFMTTERIGRRSRAPPSHLDARLCQCLFEVHREDRSEQARCLESLDI